MGEKWTASDIPNQGGRLAVVTGANSGLGLIDATELARAGADVVMACRNTEKGEDAARQVRGAAPSARVDVEALDLGDLASVRAFAERFNASHDGLDLLINNAGVMAPPKGTTADGFETQIGTNHLGHFALTGLLLSALLANPGARVVTVSSGAHRIGKINFDDLDSENGYSRWSAYGQSKLANLLFCFELDRRLRAAGVELLSVAAHPGYAATNLQSSGPEGTIERLSMVISNKLMAQSAEMGALPTLYAATAADVKGGGYFGPDGFLEQRGNPARAGSSDRAKDPDSARRLWELSEKRTGVQFQMQ